MVVELRAQILERDDYLCRVRTDTVCIDDATEIDYLIPIDQGGTDAPSNLQAVCGPCLRLKTLDDSTAAGERRARRPLRHPATIENDP